MHVCVHTDMYAQGKRLILCLAFSHRKLQLAARLEHDQVKLEVCRVTKAVQVQPFPKKHMGIYAQGWSQIQ